MTEINEQAKQQLSDPEAQKASDNVDIWVTTATYQSQFLAQGVDTAFDISSSLKNAYADAYTQETLLHPTFQLQVNQFRQELKKQNIDILILGGFRTPGRQADLYAQGRTKSGDIITNAAAFQSMHNWCWAIDVRPVVNNKVIENNVGDPAFQSMISAGRDAFSHAGVDFGDPGHFSSIPIEALTGLPNPYDDEGWRILTLFLNQNLSNISVS